MKVASALLLSLAACTRRTPSAEEAGAVAAVDAAPPVKTSRVSVARMTGGALDECVDVTLEGETDGGALADYRKSVKDGIDVPSGCGVQFKDRVALGTCEVVQATPSRTVRMTSRRYRFEDVGLSDAAMGECLTAHGTWSSVPRDSHAWRAAKLEHDSNRLRKLTGGN